MAVTPAPGRPKKHTPRWVARHLLDQLSNSYPKMSHQSLTLMAMIVFRVLKPYFTAGHWFFEETMQHFNKIGGK